MVFLPVAYDASDPGNFGTVQQELLIRQGSDFVCVIDVTNLPASGFFPWLAAYTIEAIDLHIRQPLGNSVALAEWSLDDYITHTGTGATRQIVVKVPYDDLETITLLPPTPIANQQGQAERTAGTADYDMEITVSEGDDPPTLHRLRLMEGNATVSRQVTRQDP